MTLEKTDDNARAGHWVETVCPCGEESNEAMLAAFSPYFREISSLADMNQAQLFAQALWKLFWLFELILIPSSRILKIRKSCLICSPPVVSVHGLLHECHINFWWASCPFSAVPMLGEVIMLSSITSSAGELQVKAEKCLSDNLWQTTS